MIVGQTAGYISVVRFTIVENLANKTQPVLTKLKDYQVCDKNISKVVRTTRNDLAVGTSNGMMFVSPNPNGDLVVTKEPVVLADKDITELSEYNHD